MSKTRRASRTQRHAVGKTAMNLDTPTGFTPATNGMTHYEYAFSSLHMVRFTELPLVRVTLLPKLCRDTSLTYPIPISSMSRSRDLANETMVLQFTTTYDDIAFRIANRDWGFSRKVVTPPTAGRRQTASAPRTPSIYSHELRVSIHIIRVSSSYLLCTQESFEANKQGGGMGNTTTNNFISNKDDGSEQNNKTAFKNHTHASE